MREPDRVIFTNMCMVQNGDHVLVQQRVNPNWPGVCFPGGHVEKGETFTQAVIREMQEETGLTIAHPQLCGIKHWHDGGVHQVVLLYKTTQFTGELRSSQEGRVWWAPLDSFLALPLAHGMDKMIRLFTEDDVGEFSFIEEGDSWVDVLE